MQHFWKTVYECYDCYLLFFFLLLQRNSTHTWLWRFRMWKVRPSPYVAANPAGNKTSCCESFISSSVFWFIFCFHFLFISVSLSSCCFFFMSLFCFRSVLSCTLYSQCFISLIETHLLWLSSCSFEFCNRVCALIWYSCCVQQDRRISFAQKFLSRDSAHLTEFLNMLHLQYHLYVRCYRTNKNLQYWVLDCRAIKLNDKTNKKVIWF